MDLHFYLENYDYFIFDLYGTLVDIHTDEWAEETWLKWMSYLDSKGIKHPGLMDFREEFFTTDKAYREKPTPYTYPEIEILEVYDELFTKYGNEKIPKAELSEISYEFRKCSLEYKRLFDSVEDFLEILHRTGKKVYILSNAQSSYTLPEILELGLDKMTDDFIMSSDFRVMKPDKAFFDEIVRRNNIEAERALMIGDSYDNDYQGAKEYGMGGLWLYGDDAPNLIYRRFVEDYIAK